MCMTSHPSWTETDLRDRLNDYEQELRAAGKARNTINTYVQHPERFINWLVGTYVPRAASSTPSPTGPSNSKYAPLRTYLSGRSEPVVRMTFSSIERVLGASLPNSARQYRPWWANEHNGTHVHARAWFEAGRKTANVDLQGETVDFIR